MAVEKRKKPVLKGKDAKRFLAEEKKVNDRIKNFLQRLMSKDNNNNTEK